MPQPVFIAVTAAAAYIYRDQKEDLSETTVFLILKKPTQVTSLVEGELSEPEDVVLDSSSADMDFPFRLCYRAKEEQGCSLLWG